MNLAEIIVTVAGIYLGAGLVFSLWFVARGVVRLDESAAGAGILFRLFLIPGTAALWPFLVMRLRNVEAKVSDDSTAQKKT